MIFFDFAFHGNTRAQNFFQFRSADWMTSQAGEGKEYFKNSTRKVDKLLGIWYKVVNDALDEACPKRDAMLSPVEMDWYGSDHKFLKNRAKRKYLAHRKSPCPKQRKAFVKAKRAYNRACKRGRKGAWRQFVEKTPNESNMAVLFKIAQRHDKRSINTLLKPDNTLSEPGTDTINMLTTAHFPAATAGTTPFKHDNQHKVDTDTIRDSHDWIDDDLVRKAMRQFKPNKAPGPDGLKPLVFKYLPQNAIETLTLIYKACITFGHPPKRWRETKVIFLPKPGKDNYDVPKAYIPVQLPPKDAGTSGGMENGQGYGRPSYSPHATWFHQRQMY